VREVGRPLPAGDASFALIKTLIQMDKYVEGEKQGHRINAMFCKTLAWEFRCFLFMILWEAPPISSPLFEV
jgi:hypothetical protein